MRKDLDKVLAESRQFSVEATKEEAANNKDKAIENRAAAYERLIQCYEEDHSEVAEAAYRLGKLLIGRDNQKAVQLLKEAVRVAEKTLLDGTPSKENLMLGAHMYQTYNKALEQCNFSADAENAQRRMASLHQQAGRA